MKIIQLFTIFSIVLLFSQCKKAEYKSDCCTHPVEISPCLTPDSLSIWAPRAFTPNGDGHNEVFKVSFQNVSSSDFFVKIFQGRKSLYEAHDKNFSWHGAVDQKVKEGIYSYIISGKTEGGTPFEANGKVCSILNNDNKNTPIKNCSSWTFSDMIDSRYGFIYATEEILQDCK